MSVAEEPSPKPSLVDRLRERRDRQRARPLVVRILYILVGFTLLLGGIAMLVLPGPAFVVIPIGLALLSLEFAWAEKLLERAIEQGEIAKRKASETTKTQRILTIVAVVLGVGALVAWGLMGDIPLIPDP
ncbi:MAG TPA: PGPGW domain-containing protein [Solirubrobacteraceae bacterium]